MFSGTSRDDKVIKERKQNHRQQVTEEWGWEDEFWKVMMHFFWWEEEIWMFVVVYDLHANDVTFCISHDLNMKCSYRIMCLNAWSLLLALFC